MIGNQLIRFADIPMNASRVMPVFKDVSLRPAALSVPPPVHRSEVILGALVAMNLCFLPWAFGGVDVWAQLTSLGLAMAALIVALLPRPTARETQAVRSSWSNPGRRILAFPVFWAGLVLFAYVGAQALNPAYHYNQEGIDWWLSPVDHILWLPSGMTVPFANASPTRWLTTAGTVWFTVCALWVGTTRRRTIFRLLSVISANAFIFACFGILQRASGATAVYGLRPVGYPYFFAGIIYKNHAAAFLGLTAGISFAVALYYFRQNRRHSNQSGPEIVFFLFTAILLLSLVLTFSFSGLVLFGGWFLAALLAAAFGEWRKSSRTYIPKWSVITGIVLVSCSGAVAASTGYRDWQEKIHSLFASDAHDSARMRLLANRRGWEMFQDHWVKGWGAGCFQYGFTKYQARESELGKKGPVRLRWEHVHNEWLELLIELGVIGVLPVLFIGGFWLKKIWHERVWRGSAAPMLGGLVALVAQMVIDFPIQNPAVMLTAAALLPLIVRLGELEHRV